MPVTRLYVEGALDQRILTPVLTGITGQIAVDDKGTKDDLHHIVRRELDEGKAGIAYLRDRDFDFEPPATAATEVAADRIMKGVVLGYRWDRTELENYLVDPRVVAPALNLDPSEYATELAKAATILLA